jgi:bisphosphoglycerate-independent phosphoglycerate mutase (AlkP superfamily)
MGNSSGIGPQQAMEGVRQWSLYGLVSDGGVTARQDHLYGLLRMAKMVGLSRVFVRACLDGRDTPRSAISISRHSGRNAAPGHWRDSHGHRALLCHGSR